MGFLEDYAALAVPGQTPQQSGAAQAALLTRWIIGQPGPLFAELRAQKPNFLTPGALLVSRYADVVQCLDDEDTFSVIPYGQATERDNAGPNFVLGMDYGPKYVHDISVLRLAVRWEDADGLSSFGAAAGQALIGAAQPAGTLEVSDGYGRLVGAQFVGSYFGTPGPDTATLMR